MKVDPALLILMAAMGMVTYLPRWFPLLFLSRKQIPSWLDAWLDFIPAAILSALIMPELVTVGSPRAIWTFSAPACSWLLLYSFSP